MNLCKLKSFLLNRLVSVAEVNRPENIPNWFEYVRPNFEEFAPVGVEKVLQIGAYAGDASNWILRNTQPAQLHDVDTWQGSVDEAEFNLSWTAVEKFYDKSVVKNSSKVVKFKMTSNSFFGMYESVFTYDFIYIDGSHSYFQVLIDSLNSFRVLNPGGVLAFDDYGWGENLATQDRPREAIDLFLEIIDGEYNLLCKNFQVWIRKK